MGNTAYICYNVVELLRSKLFYTWHWMDF